MNRRWKYLYPCYLWTIVMTMAGFVIASMFYKAKQWAWYDGVLTCIAGTDKDNTTLIWGKPNAQTLGWIQIFDNSKNRELQDLRVHENVHVVQAFAGSLFGLLVTPLLFVALGWSPLTGLLLGGFIGGLGFAVVYVILFLYLYIKYGRQSWYWAYRDNPFEVQAYNLQDKYIANTKSRPWGT